MNTEEHLLIILNEELVEVIEQALKASVRISKALRFGLDEIQDGQLKTNRERLNEEIADLLGVAEELIAAGIISPIQVKNKRLKIAKYMEMSRESGNLSDSLGTSFSWE